MKKTSNKKGAKIVTRIDSEKSQHQKTVDSYKKNKAKSEPKKSN